MSLSCHSADRPVRTAGAIILKLAYGYEVQEGTDSLVDLVEIATEQLAHSCTPGAFLVDVFPAMRYIPKWFPGAGWKRVASSWKQTLRDMTDLPFLEVKKRMVRPSHIHVLAFVC